jgi:lysophospholipase L1-like esterase
MNIISKIRSLLSSKYETIQVAISALIALNAFIELIQIPRDPKNSILLGLSFNRLILTIVPLLVIWICFMRLREIISPDYKPSNPNYTLTKSDEKKLWSGLTALLVAGVFILTFLQFASGIDKHSSLKAYYIRIFPLLIMVLGLLVQYAAVLIQLLKFRVSAVIRYAISKIPNFLSALKNSLIMLFKFFGISLLMLGLLLVALEVWLILFDPCIEGRKGIAFDSQDYDINGACYRGREIPADNGEYYFTWGNKVIENQLGYREEEIQIPKDPSVCRIMVLGDSLTWGAGLSLDERYTHLTEELLSSKFPNNSIEVLNFGLPGGPTVRERDILIKLFPQIQPDLIVVGFSRNDPQPRSEIYSIERTAFYKNYDPIIDNITLILDRVGLDLVSRRIVLAVENFAVAMGVFPDRGESLDRAYMDSSAEWRDFNMALADIYGISANNSLPDPIFLLLSANVIDPENQDRFAEYHSSWLSKAENAAIDHGFSTINTSTDISNNLDSESVVLHAYDGHPSALANEIFADNLASAIEIQIDQGPLCHTQ